MKIKFNREKVWIIFWTIVFTSYSILMFTSLGWPMSLVHELFGTVPLPLAFKLYALLWIIYAVLATCILYPTKLKKRSE